MPSDTINTQDLWITALSHQILAVVESAGRVEETTTTTQEMVRPLGQLLDLLARPDNQAQDLGASMAEALKKIAATLKDIEIWHAALKEEALSTSARLISLEAASARSEALLMRMAALLLGEGGPSPSA